MKQLVISLALSASFVVADAVADMNADVTALQDRWAVIRYETPENERPDAYKELAEAADAVLEAQPDNVEAHVWTGIIQSTWAGEASAFSAMKHAKRARKELELAMSMNPEALDGAVYTSLGSLLYQIPRMMGGDDEKAETYLLKGIELNPEGIDSNYFYAAFLADHDRFAEAQTYLARALAASPREGRALADRGRREEAAELESEIRSKLD